MKYFNNVNTLEELRKQYKELLKKNLLILNNNHLSIPEDKWYISNEIIVELLGSEVK